MEEQDVISGYQGDKPRFDNIGKIKQEWENSSIKV